MKIKIKRKTQNELLLWVIMLTPFLVSPLTAFFKLPTAIKYLADLSWVFLLVTMILKKKKKTDHTVKRIRLGVILFFLITVIIYLLHYQSIFYYLWGFRNNFRFFVYFFALIYYLKEDDLVTYFKFLNITFFINAIVMFYQFIKLGYEQDYLGGIFGCTQGCNAYVNLFFCITLVVSYVFYISNQESLLSFASKIVLTLILAAMAELKFFYVEFVALMIITTLITRFSFKKLLIILIASFAFMIGLHLFAQVFPDIELNINYLYEYSSNANGYTSTGDLNRLNFFSTINKEFLTSPFNRLFGLGLGNCDYADGFKFVTTSFYRHYNELHYTWMSTTHMYLENGLVGLIFIFGFFISIFVESILAIKKNINPDLCRISALCAIIGIFTLFYNNSLRMEAGYMLYTMVALPWITIDHKIIRKKRRIVLK